jgi:leucyl-tRNA synthetase
MCSCGVGSGLRVSARVVPAETPDDDVKPMALTSEKITSFTEGKQMRNVVVVKGKLVNIVAALCVIVVGSGRLN